MIRLISTAADKVLSKVVPQTTASACCPPDCWYQYWCDTTGGHRYRYRRRCCYNCACTAICGTWSYYSTC